MATIILPQKLRFAAAICREESADRRLDVGTIHEALPRRTRREGCGARVRD